jgi:hypothetical protein
VLQYLRLAPIVVAVAGITLAGCGASGAAARPTAAPVVGQTDPTYAQIASSDLAVGANRLTFGIIDHNVPLKGGSPRLTFFLLSGSSALREFSTSAQFNNFARGLRKSAENNAAVVIGGVYVAHVVFTRSGTWGVQIALHYRGRSYLLRQEITVRRHGLTPPVGSPAPRSQNPTTAQQPVTLLDSGRPPDDMHRLSIAAAIAQRKPLLVLFATAAYCTSRLCGPEIETVQSLERRYRSRVNFIHIEIYQNANPQYGYAPAVVQWHLKTEPWVFVINRKGIITAKFEGPTPASEIAPALDTVSR